MFKVYGHFFTHWPRACSFNQLHFRLPLGRQPCGGRSAAQHKRHARALVDLNTGGTWHAVAAAAAEIAREGLVLFFDERRKLVRHHRRVIIVGKKLVKLFLALYTPNGQRVLILRKVRIRRIAARDETAGRCPSCR